MFLLNGKRLAIDTPFEHEGVKYPANWLRLSSLSEKTAIGITEVPDPVYPDQRYYWVTDNGDGTLTTAPKDLDFCKAWRINEVKSKAGSILSLTDWKVIRSAETNIPLSDDVKNYRASIREQSNTFESQILACQTVEELEAIQTNFGV